MANNQNNQKEKPKEALEDIFAEVSPVAPGAKKTLPTAKSSAKVFKKPGLPGGRKLPIILIVIVVLGVLAGGLWFLNRSFNINWKFWSKLVNETVNQNNLNEANINSSEISLTNVVVTAAPDQDKDGLTDEEEAKLGTNPALSDTDHDGLFDYEEVKVYHTDPLKADTDADGYLDGDEVKKGFNPNGPGQLLNLNAALKNINE